MSLVNSIPFFSILLPITCSVACFLLDGKGARRVSLACLITLAVISGILLASAVQSGESFTFMMGHFPAPFGNEIRAGALEAFFAFWFSCILFFSLAGGLRDIAEDISAAKTNFYFLSQSLMIGAMMAIIYTNDLFTAYVFTDMITITACSIVAIKPGGRTLAATITYLLMSLIGSCLLLFSIAILYGVTGHLLMPNLQAGVVALAQSGQYILPLFMLAGLITASLAVKSALFPFHHWLPDAHANATTAASAVLSGIIIKCSLFLLIKVDIRVFTLEVLQRLHIPYLLLFFGVSGILYGSWQAIRQRDLKRMLGYASISQIGYISVGLSLNTPGGIAAACFHIAVHAAGKAMLFTAAGGLAAVSGHRKDFDSLRGAARLDPLSGAAFLLGGLAMTGIPPFPGFASKLYLALAALDTTFAIPVIAAGVVASTVLSAMYYYPAIACFFAKGAPDRAPLAAAPLSLLHRAALIGLMVMTLFLGFFSQQVLRTIEQGLAVFG